MEYTRREPTPQSDRTKDKHPPQFKRRVIDRLGTKESKQEAEEYSGGATGRKEYEGPEGLRKAAREYVLRYATTYLKDYIYSMEEIPDPVRKQKIYESALQDVEKILSDREAEEDGHETMWETYPLNISQTVRSSMVSSALKELIFLLHYEYVGLIKGSYRQRSLSAETNQNFGLYHSEIEVKPEYNNGAFIIGDIRHVQAYERYDKAPLDFVFLKNVFGMEIGDAYSLKGDNTKKDDETTSYEVLIQEARQALHAQIIDGKQITEEKARLHFPSIPPARIKDLLSGSLVMRAAFETESRQTAREGINKFNELLKIIKSDFIGIRYQERGSGKFVNGAFYPDRSGIDLLQPQGNQIYATPVFGDDLFHITNVAHGRSETSCYLGTNLFARTFTISNPAKAPQSNIFGSRVTRQTYERFLSDTAELWADVYNSENQKVPMDIALAIADAEQKLQNNVARDAMVGRVIAQIHIIRDSMRRQKESLHDDPEVAEFYNEASQETLFRYFDGQDTHVLVKAYVEVWKRNIEPDVTNAIIRVLKHRKLGDDDLTEIFREATQNTDQWASLRRSLWRVATDDEFLYSTLFRIIESGSDRLGQAVGPVAVYDAAQGHHVTKEYEWSIADIEILFDRLTERHSRAGEAIITQAQAHKAIETLLANTNNLNAAIVRFIPYITDQEFLHRLAKRWSVDAPDERLRDTPSPVDPFWSVPCRILEQGSQGLARQIMLDESFSYETRLYALSMRSSLKSADRMTVQRLLAEPYKEVTYDGRTIDLDKGRSAARVEIINRGLLDQLKDVLKHLASGPHEIDRAVLLAAQHRLKLLDEKKS